MKVYHDMYDDDIKELLCARNHGDECSLVGGNHVALNVGVANDGTITHLIWKRSGRHAVGVAVSH